MRVNCRSMLLFSLGVTLFLQVQGALGGPPRGGGNLYRERGADCWAIARNEDMADRLGERGIQATRAIVPPMPDLGRTFDVVVMNSVIEHLNTMSDARELSRPVHLLLNPGGRFVRYAPDYANRRHHFFIGDFSHSYITSWRRLEELLITGGFDRVEGCYQTATFRGVPCFLVSGVAAWLPFGWLDVLLPNVKLVRKLYKVQIGLLRRVLVAGVKKGEAAEEQA